jgi:cell pole-organizing protein PopZ
MTAAAGDPPDKDQSMDDILASIRRIMLDEQARLQDGPGALAYAAGRARPRSAPIPC